MGGNNHFSAPNSNASPRVGPRQVERVADASPRRGPHQAERIQDEARRSPRRGIGYGLSGVYESLTATAEAKATQHCFFALSQWHSALARISHQFPATKRKRLRMDALRSLRRERSVSTRRSRARSQAFPFAPFASLATKTGEK